MELLFPLEHFVESTLGIVSYRKNQSTCPIEGTETTARNGDQFQEPGLGQCREQTCEWSTKNGVSDV